MWDWIVRGGLFMAPIVACSVVGLAIVLERLWCFSRLTRADRNLPSLVVRAAEHLRVDEHSAARRLFGGGGAADGQGGPSQGADKSSQRRGPMGPVTTMLRALCDGWYLPTSERDRVVAVAATGALRQLEHRLGALDVIGRTAPLLGLLGTVVGLVKAFMVVADHTGPVQPTLLAGGIWQALLTTVAGLVVAIPAIFTHTYFQGRLDAVAFRMEEHGARLLRLAGDPAAAQLGAETADRSRAAQTAAAVATQATLASAGIVASSQHSLDDVEATVATAATGH